MQGGVAAHGATANAAATFYCAASGAYASTHPPVRLPADPSLSLVPHIFARAPAAAADARPALVDAATGEALSLADLRRLVAALAAGASARATSSFSRSPTPSPSPSRSSPSSPRAASPPP